MARIMLRMFTVIPHLVFYFIQVDFLNEQLALREAQLVEFSDKILASESAQTDVAFRIFTYY